MNELHSYNKTNSNNQIILIGSLALGFFYVCCHAFVQNFTSYFPIICISRRFLNVYCPFCGISRSCACLLKFEFYQSMLYNPLIIFIVPYLLFSGLNSLLSLSGFKFVFSIPYLARELFIYSFIFCIFTLGIVRIFTFIYPPINPVGFLIPPP